MPTYILVDRPRYETRSPQTFSSREVRAPVRHAQPAPRYAEPVRDVEPRRYLEPVRYAEPPRHSSGSHHHHSTSHRSPAPPKPHRKDHWGPTSPYGEELERFSRKWPSHHESTGGYATKAVAYGARAAFTATGGSHGLLGGLTWGVEQIGKGVIKTLDPKGYAEQKAWEKRHRR